MSVGAKRISDISAELAEAARRLLDLALKAGAKEAEVFGLEGRSVDVDLRRDQIELASESFSRGIGLRAVVNGAVGFSSTSDLSRLEVVALAAVRSARARGSDPSWVGLPGKMAISRSEGVNDPTIGEIRPEDSLDLAMDLLQGCSGVKGAEPVAGGAAFGMGTDYIINSNGVELSETGTYMHGSLEAIAHGADVVTGSEFSNSRTFKRDLQAVGRAAAEMAVSSLSGEKAESGTFEVLLKPIAFTELLEYTFIPSISADNVQKGRSHLADKLGEAIAAGHLDIVDDGLMPGGMGTSSFDGEGVATRRNSVVEEGILRGFLYDSYTAGKANRASTGNAARGGYSDVPRVGIRNLLIQSPQAFDLLGDTSKGILVNGFIGAHTANPISGDFSVEAKNAFYVSPGEALKPIRSMMLAGNIFHLLKDIEVGKDVRAVGAVVTPTVKVKMKVVSS